MKKIHLLLVAIFAFSFMANSQNTDSRIDRNLINNSVKTIKKSTDKSVKQSKVTLGNQDFKGGPNDNNLNTSVVIRTLQEAKKEGTTLIDLSEYAGKSVYIGWRDKTNDGAYLAIDNVKVFQKDDKLALDIKNVDYPSEVTVNSNVDISLTVQNAGMQKISSFKVEWKINGMYAKSQTVYENLNFNDNHTFTLDPKPRLTKTGNNNFELKITKINNKTLSEVIKTNFTIKAIKEGGMEMPNVKLLSETFTSSTCPPCARWNPVLDRWLNQHKEVNYIKYQVWWPGKDKYYIPACKTRIMYYVGGGSLGVPMQFAQGKNIQPDTYGLDKELGKCTGKSTVAIQSKPTYSGTNIRVPVKLKSTKSTSDLVLHVAICEKETTGNVGSNGEREFHHVLMAMLPSANGTSLNLTANQIQSKSFSKNMSSTNVEEMSDLVAVVFVQNKFSKKVIHSETFDIKPGSKGNFTTIVEKANSKAENVIFKQNFNSTPEQTLPAGWTAFDVDGNTPNSNNQYPYKKWGCATLNSGETMAIVTSWFTPAGTSDDWMFTPKIDLPAAQEGKVILLEYLEKQLAKDEKWYDSYELRIMVDVPKPKATLHASTKLTESNLNNAKLTINLKDEQFRYSSVMKSDFILNKAPQGTTVKSANFISKTKAEITLAFDGTDFDKDINNFSVTIKKSALKSGNSLTTNDINIKAVKENAIATISAVTPLSEDNLNGAVVKFKVSDDTFKSYVSTSNFVLNGQPNGLTIQSAQRINSTQVKLTLAFNNTDFDTDFNKFNITVKANQLNGNASLTSNSLKIKSLQESVTVNSVELDESNLNGATLTLTLTGEKFNSTLNKSDFTLNKFPQGTTIGAVKWKTNTTATITLSFDGTDFDNTLSNCNVKVNASALSRNSSLISNNFSIKPKIETVTITSTTNLSEENLNGATVNLVLSGEIFNSTTLNKQHFILNNAPQGASIQSVTRLSNTKAKVTFAFDGTDFDNDVTNCNITVKSSVLSRAADITSNNFTIKAKVETGDAVLKISASALSEANLNNANITMTLTNETFADATLSASNFILNNAPNGLTVKSVSYTNSKQATLTLAFNGSDFDTNIDNFNITVKGLELSNGKDLNSNNLTITAKIESVQIDPLEPLSESNLNGAKISVRLVSETFADATLSTSNFILNNAPSGTTVQSVKYNSETFAQITLAFNGGNLSVDIDNFNITVKSQELKSGTDLTSNDLTITSLAESVTITPEQELTESNLDGARITVRLNNEKFADATLSTSNFILNNAPNGTTVQSVNYDNPREATLTLAFNGENLDADIYDFNITVKAIELNGNTDLTSNNLTIRSLSEFVTITPAQELTESNLDGANINIVLSNAKFADNTLLATNFILNNAPNGTTVQSVNYVSETTATLVLAFTGENMISDIDNFSITVRANELHGSSDLTSNSVTIKALVESVTITPEENLTEKNLNGAKINIELTNETFADATLDKANFILHNAPATTQISTITYNSSNSADITLEFDGTDFDKDIKDFSITVKAVELNGNIDMTSNSIAIKAIEEYVEAQLIVEVQGDSLTEKNLNGSMLKCTLKNEKFIQFDRSYFILNNAPAGLNIIAAKAISQTEAMLTLTFNGMNFDKDIPDFSVTIKKELLQKDFDVVSNALTIKADKEGSPNAITEQEASVKIYPNPINDYIIIEYNAVNNDDITLSVVDNFGRVLKTESYKPQFSTLKTRLDFSNINKGCYYLIIQQGNSKTIKRIIK